MEKFYMGSTYDDGTPHDKPDEMVAIVVSKGAISATIFSELDTGIFRASKMSALAGSGATVTVNINGVTSTFIGGKEIKNV